MTGRACLCLTTTVALLALGLTTASARGDTGAVERYPPERVLYSEYRPPQTLAEALQFGTPDQVLGFLERGADPNGVIPRTRMPYLHFSLLQGALESAGYLIAHGADIHRPNATGFTALDIALERRSEVLLRFVLAHSDAAKWRAASDKTHSLLHELARRGETGLIEVLLAHGWAINRLDRSGNTPLIEALKGQRLETARLLLASQADLYVENGQDRDALYYTLQQDDTRALRLLLRAGINTRRRYENRQTPLMEAVIHGNSAAVHLLLRSGSNVHAVNDDGENALILAQDRPHFRIDIFRALLERGADANSYDDHGQSALSKAVQKRCYPCVELLLDHGAEVSDGGKHRVPGFDRLSWPPLFWAVDQRDPYLVETLLEAGADIHQRHRSDKTTAVFRTVTDETGNARMLRLLIEHGARVNIKDKDHWTPLIKACSFGGLNNVKALIEAGADVNTPNWHGWTPLMAAAQVGDSAKVALLLEHGANVNARTRRGWTALSDAKRQGNFDVVALLKRAGGTDPVDAQPRTRADRGKLKLEIEVLE